MGQKEHPIGTKVKGFRFVPKPYLCYRLEMDKHVGKIGKIIQKTKHNNYLVQFEDHEEWTYPSTEIDQHIVAETDPSRPVHYGGEDNPFEPIKVIEHYKLGFNLGNSIKYILRAGKKGDEIEDLMKAVFYLQRQINNLKNDK